MGTSTGPFESVQPFSVLMAVYAGEKAAYLDEALNSLVRQKLPAAEVVVVEDGVLTPELSVVLDRYALLLPMRRIRLTVNKGLRSALNAGLAHCTHELVARMDSDDVCLPQRFAVQIPFMVSRPNLAVSSAVVEEFDSTGRSHGFRRLPTTHEGIKKLSRFRNPLSHPVVVFRKSMVVAVGCYPDDFPEDWALWLKLLHLGYKMENLSETLLRMRTDPAFFQRRGRSLFQSEMKLLNKYRRLGYLSSTELAMSYVVRLFFRLAPPSLMSWLYFLRTLPAADRVFR